MGYAVAYNMGRSYAEKVYQAGGDDIGALAAFFERETGVKKVVLDRNAAVFTARREGASSKAVRALEFFLRGYWERLLELIAGGKVRVDTTTVEKEGIVEILVAGSR